MQNPIAPSVSPTASNPPVSLHPLHIRHDIYSGRKYHASTALTENADLLGVCVPYSYTIWKRFRNEVCAECWRYDGGRRTFLMRRDEDGLQGADHLSEPELEAANAEASSETQSENLRGKAGRGTKGANPIGAGLWFCDAHCQQNWISREGTDAIGLLREVEGARQKKAKPKSDTRVGNEEGDKEREITQESVDQAWDVVRGKERWPKEVRRWRDIQLDDYETDMARYVLLALLRWHHEQYNHYCIRARDCHCQNTHQSQYAEGFHQTESGGVMERAPGRVAPDSREPHEHEQGSAWRAFSSLQTSELSLIRACPEILGHQTRIYQLLRGRFGSGAAPHSTAGSPSRSIPLTASSPYGNQLKPAEDNAYKKDKRESEDGGCSCMDRMPELGDVVTITNVRTILGVDPGNSFGIWEVPLMEESECFGFAVYPIASFFNHHCSPNVRKKREGRTLRFLTAHAVEGEGELCISYGHVEAMDWATRQKELFEGWYFKCRCSRCTGEEPGKGQT